ncbi:MAG: ABC transporter permease [Spirochaetales bacterium]
MIVQLAARNIARGRRRLAPMVVVIVITFAVLFVGNAVLSSSQQALYGTFSEYVSGDLSVSATADSNFTIFGSDALLIGEYQVPPTLLEFEQLQERVQNMPEVRATLPAVTAAGRIELDETTRDRAILGVDFERFQDMFPRLEIVDGEYPESGEAAALVQDDWSSDLVGDRALLSTARDLSFTLREVEVGGIFEFPVEDDMLDRLILVDANTARSLNGYVYGSGGVVDLPEEDQRALESEFDDMFSERESFEEESADEDSGQDSAGTSIEQLETFFAETDQEAREERGTAEGAWNFLLVSLHDRADIDRVQARIRQAGFGPDNGFEVRDWRETVGGNAQLAWYLQLMFNIGVFFIAVGAAMITTNALVLSVLERTGEIGTMRALGATRLRVSVLILVETLMVVLGSAVVGIILGIGSSLLLNSANVVVDNPYIRILFGGEAVNARLSAALMTAHLIGGFALALASVVYPLKRALCIVPVQAMTQ